MWWGDEQKDHYAAIGAKQCVKQNSYIFVGSNAFPFLEQFTVPIDEVFDGQV
jgi:hypothetical protein